jgi:hypothetical protein
VTSSQSDVTAVLARQRRHQLRLRRRRMTWWIPSIFVLGLAVSLLGLVPALAIAREHGSATPAVFVFAASTTFFGWVVVLWLFGDLFVKPRIVPYFARPLGPYGGPTMAAFARGRSIHREIATLERLATTLGVTPLSAFGVADDHYEQEVRWQAASDGCRTVDALRAAVTAHGRLAPDVAGDLDALASVLGIAVEAGVDFSLVLRLHARDSMQAVCTREPRQGSFW